MFSVMDAVMKGLVIALGAITALLWRNAAGVVLSGALYLGRGRRWPGRAALRIHALRGAVGAVMAVTFFWGLARIPMAQAIALAFVAPVLAILLAALILKERVPRGAVVACALAAAGVGLIVAGGAREGAGAEAAAGRAAVLVSAVCYAFNILLMRVQSQMADAVEVAFFQSVVVTMLLAAIAPWFATVPEVRHAPAIVGAAVLATASLMLLAHAYARAPASYLAPTEYTSFLWAALLGWAVFGEGVSAWTIGGAALIAVGSVIAARGAPPPLIPGETPP